MQEVLQKDILSLHKYMNSDDSYTQRERKNKNIIQQNTRNICMYHILRNT